MEPDPEDCWPPRRSFAQPLRLDDRAVMAEWMVRLGVDEAAIQAAAARVGRMPAALEAFFQSVPGTGIRPAPPRRRTAIRDGGERGPATMPPANDAPGESAPHDG